MKEIVEKLKIIEKETSIEKGEYDLFALFLREDSPNKWDIVVAAGWISNNRKDALKYLASHVQNALTLNQIVQISHIALIDENNPALHDLQQVVSVEHGSAEIKNAYFFDLEIKHGFLITSRNRQAA